MTQPDPFEHDDAAYVMGLLSDDDLAAFEAHLSSCEGCRERVAQLRPTAGLLAAVGTDDLSDALQPDLDPGAVPATLLPGLLRRAGIRRRRERWLSTGISGLAVASLVALLVAVWPAGSTGNGGHPVALTALTSTPLRATADVTSTSWGTRISLDCDYYAAAGSSTSSSAGGVSYALTVVAKDGTRHSLGTWTVAPGRHTKFTSGTALPDSALRSIEITSNNGTPLLALEL